jgi:hypothetical protein
MTDSYTLPEMKCLRCDAVLNQASDNHEDSRPEPGDFTVCLYCEHLMVFKNDLTLREPTNNEAVEADTNSDLHEVREFIKFYRTVRDAASGKLN